MSNQQRTVVTSGNYVRAKAPGAESIEIEFVQAPQAGGYGGYSYGGYGYYYDPLVAARRTFYGWLTVSVVLTGAAVALHQPLFLLPLPVFGIICIRSAYDHYRLLTGGWGSFMSFLMTPSHWWPTDPVEVAAAKEAVAQKAAAKAAMPSLPLSHRLARAVEAVRSAWFRVRQVPGRMYCAVAGRPKPAPPGTLRLTFERRETLDISKPRKRSR